MGILWLLLVFLLSPPPSWGRGRGARTRRRPNRHRKRSERHQRAERDALVAGMTCLRVPGLSRQAGVGCSCRGGRPERATDICLPAYVDVTNVAWICTSRKAE